MIINRRTFLGATAGIGIGSLAGITPAVPAAGLATGRLAAGPMPDEYEQILATTPDLKYLGCPRSWSVVEQGFLPIAADRVLILIPEHRSWHRDAGDGWAYEHRSLRQRLGAKLAAKGMPLPDEKLALCVRIAFELGRFYNVPEHSEDWAYRMAWRESLAATGIANGVAVPHQYQTYGPVATANGYVDWWLILFPQAINSWGSLDDQPVHLMFTHVYARPASEDPANYLGPLGLFSKGLRSLLQESPEFAVATARLDRVSAARLVNRHVVLAMQGAA
ncbi:MAG: hypothetical protein NTY19_16045 [Planctomycetota bacterium]|nr:hypothetical protein [Planctomycetota bacterium]